MKNNFERVFVEKEIINDQSLIHILKQINISHSEIIEITNINDYFNRKKKPYLQKRTNLNLFIGKKKGTIVKKAPDAYGLVGEPHYYFINAYNCIYECKYCYLQGYFNSPDLVIFINHKEMCEQMLNILNNSRKINPKNRVWFHAGEFSDSLALSHITDELKYYHNFLSKNPEAIIELRTKSDQIKKLLELSPLPNLIASFSLAPEKICQKIDLKTPSLSKRLEAMGLLVKNNHPIAIHLDPVFVTDSYEEDYKLLIENIIKTVDVESIEYVSIGVVRFTKDVFHQVKSNYPNSIIESEELITSFDGKIRYPRPIRKKALNKIKEILISNGLSDSSIYLCMED